MTSSSQGKTCRGNSTLLHCFPEPIRWCSVRVIAAIVLIGLLLAIPVLSQWLGQSFYLTLATRIVIFAIVASGLNLLVGFGGLVSMGHAMFVGLGAYAVGISSFHGFHDGWLHIGIAILITIAVSLLTGLVSLRTRGIGFIMITLAFGQMFYFLFVSLKQYGGDDGLLIPQRSQFAFLPDLSNKVALYYVSVAVLLLVMGVIWRVVHSRFGYVLRGFKANEQRMVAAGFPRLRYQLSAYVASAVICALAGVLLANLTLFASPSYLSWQASGDYVLMIVLGGMGTVMGPLLGTTVFLLLEEALSGVTQHWMAIIGLFIFLIALFSRKGLWGALIGRSSREVQS